MNADDLGLSPGVDAGIVEAMTRGHVQTTSAMVCDRECRERVAISAKTIAGRVGLHLQLTDGRPMSDPRLVPSLVDAEGRFPRKPSITLRWRPEEVLREWRQQLAALREAGVEPSHLDSHHHAHLVPGAREAYVELARETGLRARSGHPWIVERLRAAGLLCPDRCETPWSGDAVHREQLTETLRRVASHARPGALIEVSCHPARPDAGLEARSSYAAQRGQELAWLCDPDLPAQLAEEGFVLVGANGALDLQVQGRP